MENSGEFSQPTQESIKKENIVAVDQKYEDSFGIKKAIILNPNPNPDTVRIFRGVRNYTRESLINQTSNMMRDYGGEINGDMAGVVENLANHPNPENYQNVIGKAKKLNLKNFIPEKLTDFGHDFKDNLVLQHRNTIRSGIGTSPFVAATADPFEAFKSTGVNGAILIIDIAKDRLTPSQYSDENEVLINGFIKEDEISAVLPIEDDTVPIVDPFSTEESKSQALIELSKKLVPINPLSP